MRSDSDSPVVSLSCSELPVSYFVVLSVDAAQGHVPGASAFGSLVSLQRKTVG